ncbi:MAG: hypothetical protein HQM07_07405, partial [Zetaproteobacteria bacterium]|nr:hypothetical protein [Zetaproteobacteria bacterium]
MKELLLRIKQINESTKLIPFVENMTIPVDPSAIYAVVEASSQKVVSDVTLIKKADSVLIRAQNRDLVILENFYDQTQDQAFIQVADSSALTDTMFISRTDAVEPQSNIVWEATQHGSSPQEAIYAEDPVSHTPSYSSASSSSLDLGWGAIALGVGAVGGGIAIAAAAGGGKGGAAAPVASPVNTVAGTIVAGIVIAGNDLFVSLYQADGTTLIKSGIAVNATGQFSTTVGAYTGVVVAKVSNGPNNDYLDEATGLPINLNANLSCMGVISTVNSTLTLNINPLTTIAHQAAVQAGPLDVATVNNTNSAIATAFQLPDLLTTTVVATNSGNYNDTNGLSAGESYGAVLAALSGADKNNNGNSQTTIDDMVANISVAGNTATLSSTAQSMLSSGAAQITSTPSVATSVNVLDTTAPSAPTFNAVSVDNLINAAENTAGFNLT